MKLTGYINIKALTGKVKTGGGSQGAENYLFEDETEDTLIPNIVTTTALTLDGTKHIMLDIAPTDKTDVVVSFSRSSSNTQAFLFGARKSSSSGGSIVLSYSDSTTYPMFGTMRNSLSETCTADEFHTAEISQDGYYLDGVLKREYTDMSFTLTESLCIGGVNTEGAIDTRKFVGTIYSVTIYENSALVRELYPAQRLDSSGTVTGTGLVDVLTGTYYETEASA